MMDAYLIHFSQPFGHAQHYIGITRKGRAEERLAEHRSGKGAVLCRHASQAGVELILAKVWPGVPRSYELQLKARGSAKRICPICKEQP